MIFIYLWRMRLVFCLKSFLFYSPRACSAFLGLHDLGSGLLLATHFYSPFTLTF
jgi:hypothetical protein